MAEAEHNEDGKHATPVVVDEKVGLSEEDAGQCTAQDQPDIDYPPFRKVLVIMFGLFIAAFLVALDRTIIGTAIPKITDDFHSLGDVSTIGFAGALSLTIPGWLVRFSLPADYVWLSAFHGQNIHLLRLETGVSINHCCL